MSKRTTVASSVGSKPKPKPKLIIIKTKQEQDIFPPEESISKQKTRISTEKEKIISPIEVKKKSLSPEVKKLSTPKTKPVIKKKEVKKNISSIEEKKKSLSPEVKKKSLSPEVKKLSSPKPKLNPKPKLKPKPLIIVEEEKEEIEPKIEESIYQKKISPAEKKRLLVKQKSTVLLPFKKPKFLVFRDKSSTRFSSLENVLGYIREPTDNLPIYCILIHGTWASSKKETSTFRQFFTNNVVPQNFFGPDTNKAKMPNYNLIEWHIGTGDISHEARIEGAIKLAQFIAHEHEKYPRARFICIAHSHGGNVINLTSNILAGNVWEGKDIFDISNDQYEKLFEESNKEIYHHTRLRSIDEKGNSKKVIDYVIQLATPVIMYNKDIGGFDYTSNYCPNPYIINILMIFYSDIDIIQSGGGLGRGKRRRYPPIPNIYPLPYNLENKPDWWEREWHSNTVPIDLYNIRLRKRMGLDDLHTQMDDEVIGKNIFPLCMKIKNTYKINKNLIADITPQEQREEAYEWTIANIKNKQIKFNAIVLLCALQQEICPLISIKIFDETKGLEGKTTDSYWRWESKSSISKQIDEEINASNEDNKIFDLIFNFPITERWTETYRAIAGFNLGFKKHVGKKVETNIINPIVAGASNINIKMSKGFNSFVDWVKKNLDVDEMDEDDAQLIIDSVHEK